MNYPGHTRSARRSDHIVQAPDTFVRAPLPGMAKATAVVHASPALGARFTEYTVEFEAGGTLPGCADQRFIFVLEGAVSSAAGEMAVGEYGWFPPHSVAKIRASNSARAVVIEKPWIEVAGVTCPPGIHRGREQHVATVPLMGDEAVEVRALMPPGPEYDFAVNTMTFQPGATLPMVEMHVMEHGLVMLQGQGIYRLGDSWYPVAAGDFIWMAPWLPQWFGALGKVPAKYLIYKDWNR